LADWRRESGSLEAEGAPQALAEEFATAIEQQYLDDDIKVLVKNKGLKAE
jgi:hypothetical protein